jgi:hypothetical protein
MMNHGNQIPQNLIESAVSHAFDSERSLSENLARMKDYLGQFTGPLNRQDDIGVEFAFNDEIARRESLRPFGVDD